MYVEYRMSFVGSAREFVDVNDEGDDDGKLLRLNSARQTQTVH